MTARAEFPIGASVTVAQLDSDPHAILAELRASEPVSWLPALNGWMITRRATAIEVMRDPVTFTVDDPRFTTDRVVGPSMLSRDGDAHSHHRAPFMSYYRPSGAHEVGPWIDQEARRLVSDFLPSGQAELRTALAAPLAVSVITRSLGLEASTVDEVLSWYRRIAEAVSALTAGKPAPGGGAAAMAELGEAVRRTIDHAPSSMLAEVAALSPLDTEEIVSNTGVIMFGAIETAEGMIANALYHVLSNPAALGTVVGDRSLVAACIEESLRLEPAAAVVDRFATRSVELDRALVSAGDLVVVSIAAAGRDPEAFSDPDTFDIHRTRERSHVAFATGPHACLGAHLARRETAAALNAVLDLLPDVALDPAAGQGPRGLIFRKAQAVAAIWPQ